MGPAVLKDVFGKFDFVVRRSRVDSMVCFNADSNGDGFVKQKTNIKKKKIVLRTSLRKWKRDASSNVVNGVSTGYLEFISAEGFCRTAKCRNESLSSDLSRQESHEKKPCRSTEDPLP